MLGLLINLLVFALVFGVIWWVFLQIPLPEPFAKIVRIILVVLGCLILISFMLDIAGMGYNIRLIPSR